MGREKMKALWVLTALLLIVVFDCNAETVADQMVTFAATDNTNSPVKDLKITGRLSNKTRGNTVWSKEESRDIPFSCITNESGFCSVSVSLVRYEYWGKDSFDVDGGIEGLQMPDGAKLDVKFPIRFSEKIKNEKLTEKKFAVLLDGVQTKVIEARFADGYRAENTVSFYTSLIDLKDDELEVLAMISSRRAHQRLNSSLPQGSFFRVFVDKKTLKASYQIYVVDTYRGFGFRTYNIAKYQATDQVRAVPATRISQDVNCAEKVDGQCLYQESVVFDLDEKTMSEIAASFKPDVRKIWKFRLSSHSGEDLDLNFLYAEFAAVHDRVGQYVSKSQQKSAVQ